MASAAWVESGSTGVFERVPAKGKVLSSNISVNSQMVVGRVFLIFSNDGNLTAIEQIIPVNSLQEESPLLDKLYEFSNNP